MSDTVRSLDDLKLRFRDNTSGEIIAQDFRDLIVTPYSECAQVQSLGNSLSSALSRNGSTLSEPTSSHSWETLSARAYWYSSSSSQYVFYDFTTLQKGSTTPWCNPNTTDPVRITVGRSGYYLVGLHGYPTGGNGSGFEIGVRKVGATSLNPLIQNYGDGNVYSESCAKGTYTRGKPFNVFGISFLQEGDILEPVVRLREAGSTDLILSSFFILILS